MKDDLDVPSPNELLKAKLEWRSDGLICSYAFGGRSGWLRITNFIARVARATIENSRSGSVCLRTVEVTLDGRVFIVDRLTPSKLLSPVSFKNAILNSAPVVPMLPYIRHTHWRMAVDRMLADFSDGAQPCQGLAGARLVTVH